MALYGITTIHIRRPSGSWEKIGGLRSADFSLDPEIYRGAATPDGSGFFWNTSKGGVLGWSLSAEANAAPSDGGIMAAKMAARRGELLGIQITMGDGRVLVGSAYCQKFGRGGDVRSAFAASMSFTGHGALSGLTEDLPEEYPDSCPNIIAIWDPGEIVAADEDEIVSIADLSGNGRTLSQRAGTWVYDADGGPNSEPCLTGTGASLISTGVEPDSTCTLFMVVRDDGGGRRIYASGNNSGTSSRISFGFSTSLSDRWFCQRSQLGLGFFSSDASLFSDWSVMALVLDTPNTRLRKNGSLIGSMTVGGASWGSMSSGTHGIILGDSYAPGVKFDWQIAFCALIDCTGSELDAWEDYLMTRFAISP